MGFLNFSHLLGRAPSASEEDEDDKEKGKRARKAEDDKKKDGDDCCEEDDDNKKEGKKGADDGDDDDSGDDPDAEEDDDEDKDEKKDVKKGRKAERDRCAAIFASQHAAGRPSLAASLAFNTNMPAKAAIGVLASSALETKPGRRSLDERMEQVKNVKIGPDGSPEGKSVSAVVNKATALYNQAKGKKS